MYILFLMPIWIKAILWLIVQKKLDFSAQKKIFFARCCYIDIYKTKKSTRKLRFPDFKLYYFTFINLQKERNYEKTFIIKYCSIRNSFL